MTCPDIRAVTWLARSPSNRAGPAWSAVAFVVGRCRVGPTGAPTDVPLPHAAVVTATSSAAHATPDMLAPDRRRQVHVLDFGVVTMAALPVSLTELSWHG